MAELERLSTLVCHDLTVALIDETALEAELRELVERGSICRTTGLQLLDLVHEVEQSTHTAYVGAERSDEVLANFGYFLKRGMGVEPHQYLRERRRDVAVLSCTKEKACDVVAPQALNESLSNQESPHSDISTAGAGCQEVKG